MWLFMPMDSGRRHLRWKDHTRGYWLGLLHMPFVVKDTETLGRPFITFQNHYRSIEKSSADVTNALKSQRPLEGAVARSKPQPYLLHRGVSLLLALTQDEQSISNNPHPKRRDTDAILNTSDYMINRHILNRHGICDVFINTMKSYVLQKRL